ncbi:long-chain-fatty-acid--CoA ligase 1-like [Centruroides sculpturatus]|uniref:long-chain-fatty-acid--CoA ligase 1-like n=1 Tax=Centruroides sculpturatus TaxID=218467 RepID=UPI000C6CC46B|nr:long-chain-fatty-acid--CoA ligase 1-like [Centruroides sculpturatus]
MVNTFKTFKNFCIILGSVGPPLPNCHIKLIDVPEMGYLAQNDAGEICIRGPGVFKGYFKNPTATKEALDENGWLHTGDIGRWLPNGSLAIIDRKKHLLKLSQGEYVVPEKVENIYSQYDVILQIFVDGFSDQDYLVSVIVPEKATFIKWAKRKNFDTSDYDKLCSNKNVRATLLKKLHKIGKANGLNSLEQVNYYYYSFLYKILVKAIVMYLQLSQQ